MFSKRIYLFIFFISIVSFSCDLFKIRDPEKPSEAKSNFLPPTSPDVVLNNLKNSISEKNSLNYTQCLSDYSRTGLSYSFIPPPDVQKSFISIFLNWDLESEKSYFENLKSHLQNNSKSELTLTGTYTTTQSDSVIYNLDYSISLVHDVSSIPQIIRGNMQLSISRDKNNNWSITKWIDNKINNQFCWSELKARFSN